MLGAFAYGLFLKDSSSGSTETGQRTSKAGQGDILLELERETQQSSGKYWFGKEEDSKTTPPG